MKLYEEPSFPGFFQLFNNKSQGRSDERGANGRAQIEHIAQDEGAQQVFDHRELKGVRSRHCSAKQAACLVI